MDLAAIKKNGFLPHGVKTQWEPLLGCRIEDLDFDRVDKRDGTQNSELITPPPHPTPAPPHP